MKYQDNILFIYCLHSIKIVTNGQSILLRFNVLGVLWFCLSLNAWLDGWMSDKMWKVCFLFKNKQQITRR